MMLRSKSRSGSVDFGQKNHYGSVFSRTLSASKLCRGDNLGAQIDTNALIEKKPPKVSNLSENRVDRVESMQQRMGEMEEELRRTKERLSVSEVEKCRVVDQLREAKEVAEEDSVKANEALVMEIESLKRLLSGSRDELKTKDKKICSLEVELGRLEEVLVERDASTDELKRELRDVREREKDMVALLSENKRRIQELEVELERTRRSELGMANALAAQSKQLEDTVFELQEAKIETTSLHEKIDTMEVVFKQCSEDNDVYSEHEIRHVKYELQLAQEGEKKASLKARSLLDEMALLKNEWKLAVEAEEKSTKAMEDLALVLKEVATEAKLAKEKLGATEIELEHVKGEAEQLKGMLRSTEERYGKLLLEARQEAELHRNTADRLRLEADETLLAWNGKEMGFVSCIKRAEEERAVAAESLKEAENKTKAAKQETHKLRDILKQAVNEANAAKAAAGLARDENSTLKDYLSEKEEKLLFLSRENERLKISEAAAKENVKQLKKLLPASSTEDSEDEEHGHKSVSKTFSFNLEDVKFMNEPDDVEDKILDEDPEKAEALKGSIFDTNAETPRSESHNTPRAPLAKPRRYSFAYGEQTTPTQSDDFYHSDSAHDETYSDKNTNRKGKTMFKRVGDLLTKRKSFHKKEPSSVQA